jgi:hypothetical protein
VILSYVALNLALSLYVAYRRPTTRFSDYPAMFVVVSALTTLLVVLWTAWKERGR